MEGILCNPVAAADLEIFLFSRVSQLFESGATTGLQYCNPGHFYDHSLHNPVARVQPDVVVLLCNPVAKCYRIAILCIPVAKVRPDCCAKRLRDFFCDLKGLRDIFLNCCSESPTGCGGAALQSGSKMLPDCYSVHSGSKSATGLLCKRT